MQLHKEPTARWDETSREEVNYTMAPRDIRWDDRRDPEAYLGVLKGAADQARQDEADQSDDADK